MGDGGGWSGAIRGEMGEGRGGGDALGGAGRYASLFLFLSSLRSSGDMKYGFSAEPSFRSRSSTATRSRGAPTGVGAGWAVGDGARRGRGGEAGSWGGGGTAVGAAAGVAGGNQPRSWRRRCWSPTAAPIKEPGEQRRGSAEQNRDGWGAAGWENQWGESEIRGGRDVSVSGVGI